MVSKHYVVTEKHENNNKKEEKIYMPVMGIERLRDGSLQNQFLPGRFAPKPFFERDGSPRDGSLHL